VRDIPEQYIEGGNSVVNLRQVLQQRMRARGLVCRCIRCREPRDKQEQQQQERREARRRRIAKAAHTAKRRRRKSSHDGGAGGGAEGEEGSDTPDDDGEESGSKLLQPPTKTDRLAGNASNASDRRRSSSAGRGAATTDVQLMHREYESSGGREVFLSFETPDESLVCGFLRLRLSAGAGLGGQLRELEGAALVRELHVYGKMRPVGDESIDDTDDPDGSGNAGKSQQHLGFGRRLVARAEELAAATSGVSRVAVIAGIGARDYYRGLGYRLEGTYMVKDLPPKQDDARLAMLLNLLLVGVALVGLLGGWGAV
jgi:histone acetyltransferase (RNA polymerase elongator complex component)